MVDAAVGTYAHEIACTDLSDGSQTSIQALADGKIAVLGPRPAARQLCYPLRRTNLQLPNLRACIVTCRGLQTSGQPDAHVAPWQSESSTRRQLRWFTRTRWSSSRSTATSESPPNTRSSPAGNLTGGDLSLQCGVREGDVRGRGMGQYDQRLH